MQAIGWCVTLSQLTRTSSKFVNSDPLDVGGDLQHISYGKTGTVSLQTSQVAYLIRLLMQFMLHEFFILLLTLYLGNTKLGGMFPLMAVFADVLFVGEEDAAESDCIDSLQPWMDEDKP